MEENRSTTDSYAPSAAHHPDALPPAWATRALIAVNVLIYIAVAASVGKYISLPTLALLAWGGNFTPAVADGEYWRPVTSMFLHGGLIHLGLNMLALLSIGSFLERLFGITTYALIYLLAGLSGSLASLAWHSDTVGVGASGAIFGLFGALLGFLLVRRHVIPPDVLQPMLKNALTLLGINLLLGFTIPNVDNAAHIGGAAAGFVGGLAATWPLAESPRAAWLIRHGLLLLLILLAATAVPFVSPTKSARAQGQLMLAMDEMKQEEKAIRKRFKDLVSEHSSDENGKAFADDVEREVLEPWQTMSARFPPQEDLPESQQANPITAPMYRYLKIMEEAFRLAVEAYRTGDEAVAQQADNKMREVEKLIEEMREKK